MAVLVSIAEKALSISQKGLFSSTETLERKVPQAQESHVASPPSRNTRVMREKAHGQRTSNR